MTKKHEYPEKQKHEESPEEQPSLDVDSASELRFSHASKQVRDTAEEGVVTQLQNEVEQLQSKVSELTDKMLRFRADAENTERRARIDVENAHRYGMEKFARELLDVVDSLERGLEMHKESEHDQLEHMQKGMELTHKLLLDTLQKFSIKQIDPLGDNFDPAKHEALTTQPTNEMEPNKVLNVVQKGFEIHDRVLRPARVVVAKAPEDVAS